jgi:tetratricopeptide (TPR) repeat protein
MPHRALLALLLLALPAVAADVVRDEEVEPHLKDLQQRWDQVAKGAVKAAELVQYYEQRAQSPKGTKRDRAISAFLYGLVRQMIPPVRDVAEARRQYERAIELEPGFLMAHHHLAALTYEAGNRGETDRILRHILGLDPAYFPAIIMQADLARQDGDYERAKKLFGRAAELNPSFMPLVGLISMNVALHHKTVDEKEKAQYAGEALQVANALLTLEPSNPRAWLAKAQLLYDLGRIKEAIGFLEEAYASSGLSPADRAKFLRLLLEVYQFHGDVANAKRTLKRVLEHDLSAEEKARYGARLSDLETLGRSAFISWGVKDLQEVLANDGLSVEQRLVALRRLLDFLTSEASANPALKPLYFDVFRSILRTLVDAPPDLVTVTLRWCRTALQGDANLVRVLVHYVHPGGVTEDVREEALRAIGACGGIAALPAVYYSLQDASGRVVREADNQLSVICEHRSALGGGTHPFSDDEMRQARRQWATFFHSADGAQRLIKSFADLTTRVRVDPERTTTSPMIDHAANVLLDNDVPWEGWAAAYTFLVQYWGKDFRPVERRGKPVEEHERVHVVNEFSQEYRATRASAAAAAGSVQKPPEKPPEQKPPEKPPEKKPPEKPPEKKPPEKQPEKGK